MAKDVYGMLLDFLTRLDQSKIRYRLRNIREDAILVDISVPSERWEVEFMRDGSVEVERFITTVSIEGRERLEELFERFTD